MKEYWGEHEGASVFRYTVENSRGMVMRLTNFGARLCALLVPDQNAELDDVVLGFDDLAQYLAPNPCFGATIGRYANRIRAGEFTIDGQRHLLTTNDGVNTLHGAGEFENAVWFGTEGTSKYGKCVRFSYISPDGKFGFPGKLRCEVSYTLTEDNAVRIQFEAESDKQTHVNLTHHSYFNLNGARDLIYDHVLQIDADRYLELDEAGLATGNILNVRDKPWALTKPTRLGDNIHRISKNGYHHNYVLNKPLGELAKVASVVDPGSGRTMVVYTTQPSVVFYAANGFEGDITGKYGIQYPAHIGFCLETQHHTDSANHHGFPSTLLQPGAKYQETVIYKFSHHS